MTRVVTVLFLALAVALSGLVGASPASAVTSSVAYTLAPGDQVLSTPLGTDSNPCAAGSGSGSFAYKAVRLKVSASGPYVVADAGPGDGRVGVYAGDFNPGAPLSGCLVFVDVDEAVALTAGTTYTLVQSTSTSALAGAFSVTFDGPGTAAVLSATTTTLTTDPDPSELSRATTLKAAVAGGATPSGTVEFRDGATLLGSAPLNGGVARLTVSSLAVGSHALSAAYLGDGTHDVSTGTSVHKVKYGPKPAVKLTVSDRTPYVGQKIKLSWVASGADTLKASGDWKGKRQKKGSRTITVRSLGFHVYKLKATNVNGSDRAKVKLVAQRAPKKFTVGVPDEFLTRNSQVRVRATGLDAKERFKVFLDDALLAKGFADQRGNASALVRIRRTVEEGEHTLTVVGSNRNRTGSVEVKVLAPKELDVEVAKAKIRVDETQTVTVTGLLEGEAVTVTYLGEVVAEAVADGSGELKRRFKVGGDVGTMTVEVVGAVPGRSGEASFKVVAAPNVEL